MKTFLKKGQIQLVNGGYLVNEKEEPVSNSAFLMAQKHAEYIVTFAEKAKGRDFKGKEAESLENFRKEVMNMLNSPKLKNFVALPEKPSNTTTEKLKKEALEFVNFQNDTDRTKKINSFLNNHFGVVAEFEEFGLFFAQDLVKLNKIYTMDEVVKAIESVVELL